MKEIIKDFLNLFSNSLIIISLMLSSFLLLINLYHYKEVNLVYNYNNENNETYVNFKDTITNIEKNMSKVNLDTIPYSTKVMVLKVTEGRINKCISLLKETDFYNKPQGSLQVKQLYDLNDNLYGEIQNQCLFMVNYYINSSLDEYKLDSSSYDPIEKSVSKTIEYISNYSSYLRNDMLQNSSYGYTTITTRNTIINKLAINNSLLINNYNNLIEAVEEMTKWYIEEAGGNYE